MNRNLIALIILLFGLGTSLGAQSKQGFFQRIAQMNPFLFGNEVNVQDDVVVEVIEEASAPVKLLSAEVKDKGTSLLRIKGLEQAFTTKVKNVSSKHVLAYQLVWERHLPFEEFAEQDFRINSANAVKKSSEDILEFRKPIHYRSDAFYKVFVAKVMFDDGTVWKSSHDFDVGGYWADIKKTIEESTEPES